jgi:hypothetical protein
MTKIYYRDLVGDLVGIEDKPFVEHVRKDLYAPFARVSNEEAFLFKMVQIGKTNTGPIIRIGAHFDGDISHELTVNSFDQTLRNLAGFHGYSIQKGAFGDHGGSYVLVKSSRRLTPERVSKGLSRQAA